MKQLKKIPTTIISTALTFAISLMPVQCCALSASGTDYSKAKSIILKAATENSATANISSLKIPESSADDLYFDFLDEYPELYRAYFPSYNYVPGSNILTKYLIRYYDCDDNAFTKAVSKALNLSIKSGMSDFEKALSLHDYLVTNCEYDIEAAESGEFSISDTAYGALVNKTAICQGYSLAYCHLLRLAGLEAHMISSPQMNHSWNLVKIGDYWYHVDCTWDDPIFDSGSKDEDYVDHTFFMLSDAAMAVAGPADPASAGSSASSNWQSTRHYGWETTIKCTDTSYDDGGTWGKLTTPVYEISASGLFEDVPDDSYYFDAVTWAVYSGVTSGTTDTTFEPLSTCTRGQVVAFLWRALGKPEPNTIKNPFADVKENSYYYKAVLWANENGIVYGTSDTKFDPSGTCTSAQVLAFLWRALGRPEAENKITADKSSGEKQQGESLSKQYAGTYYEGALAWAEPYGLLDDTDGPFNPSSPSPRANIVTYLYRVYCK